MEGKMGQEFTEIKLRCYKFSLSVIQLVDFVKIKKIFYSLIDQLLRSSTSIGANLVEARSAHSKKDFIKFYEISLKSSNETKYWLCLLRDGLKIDTEKINKLLKEADEISKVIASIVVKLKNIKTNIIKEEYIPYGDNSDDIILFLSDKYKLSGDE